jgi:CBS-domain-containing membrane protein
LLQSALATLVLLVVMWGLDVVAHGILVASVGSTVFILFAIPYNVTAKARNTIGSHTICGLIGSSCAILPLTAPLVPLKWSLAVGVAIFAMVVTDTEHPPSAGTALAFAISGWDLITYLRLVLLVVGVWIGALLFRPWMRDLV